MTAAVKAYRRAVANEWHCQAAWLPNVRFSLGDVGTTGKHGVFSRLTTLDALGVSFETNESSADGDFKLVAAKDCQVSPQAGAAAPTLEGIGTAEARLAYKFGSGNAVLCHFWGCLHSQVVDQQALARDVKRLRDAKRWDRGFKVLTSIVRAERGVVVVTGDQASEIEFSLAGSVDLADVNLADASAGCKIGRSRNVVTQLVTQSGITPLFQLSGYKKGVKAPTGTWDPNVMLERVDRPGGQREGVPVTTEVFGELKPEFDDD